MKSPHPNFSHYPLGWLAVSFAFGIVVSKYSACPPAVSLILAITCGLVATTPKQNKFAEAFLTLAFCCAGGFVYSGSQRAIHADRVRSIVDSGQINSGEPVEIEGVLLGKPEPAFDGFFLIVRVDNLTHNAVEQSASGKVRLFASIPNEEAATDYAVMELRYGTRIRVACALDREEKLQNPGVISQTEMLDQQGIDATAIIKSPLLIEVLGRDRVFAPLAWIYDQRVNIISALRNNLSQPASGVLIASLLGDRNFLDKRTADVFREGGTFHVLVISGLHITFIGGLLLLFLRTFVRNRFWSFLIATGLLWSYALAVGAEVPVVRATIMFTVLAFSQVLHRKGTLLNGLGLCALLILVWRPQDLFTASFQLTFVSVAAIVIIAFPLIGNLRAIGSWTPTVKQPFPPNTKPWLTQLCELLYWREEVWESEIKRHVWSAGLFKFAKPRWIWHENVRKITAYIVEAALVSTIVQICLLPFVVIYFHRISFASVLLNIWVGLVIALESFAAVIGLVLSNISSALAGPFFKIAEGLNWLLVSLPGWFVDGGWTSFRLPAYSGYGRAVYFLHAAAVVFIAYLLFKWKPFALKRKDFAALRIVIISLVVLLAIVVLHPFSAPQADGKLHFDFLDVGQGDSVFITFPDGQTMLVDGGGHSSLHAKDDEDGVDPFEPDQQRIGEAVVSAFLWEKGYATIDYILATHADADHIQGLTDVAKNFQVKYAFFGRTPANDADFAELADVLQKKKIPYATVSRGDEMNVDGVSVQFLSPEADDSPNAVSDNNHSVVLRVVYGSKKILLTGDIEKAAENNLLARSDLLAADIIKVPHHGSRTSSTEPFVAAVKPQFAVISVGKHSPFGHPNAEVVDRWQVAGSAVLKTGELGTISVSTDGSGLQVESFVKN